MAVAANKHPNFIIKRPRIWDYKWLCSAVHVWKISLILVSMAASDRAQTWPAGQRPSKGKKRESIRKQEEPWPWIAWKVASWPSNKRCGVWSGRGSCRLARDHSGQLGRGWIHFVLWELSRTEHIKLLLTLAVSVPSVRVAYAPASAPPILRTPHLDTMRLKVSVFSSVVVLAYGKCEVHCMWNVMFSISNGGLLSHCYMEPAIKQLIIRF